MEKFEKIYREYFKLVYKYLYYLTQNTDISEELTQETFYKAIVKINTFKKQSKLSTWLCQIAKNLWYNELKKNKKLDIIDDDFLKTIASNENIEDTFIKTEERKELFNKINSLEPMTRKVMFLRIHGDLSFKEIAAILRKK